MKRTRPSIFPPLMAFLVALLFVRVGAGQEPGGSPVENIIRGLVVATGIPGAGAIAQVGTIHTGGPFRDNATFAAATQPGRVLHRPRLFVASTSNFGAPLARPAEAPGSILSIDVSEGAVTVPPDFARADGQASAAGGRVLLYTAQSPAFFNSVNNPSALTFDQPAVSLPLGISFNNGFGRPWFASAPNGSEGDGTISVTDPSGVPLAGAPSAVAGGVFAGTLTNRDASTRHGLTAAAIATALATKSPDQSVRAVFFAALADGSIAQVHVQRGVDGFAPPGSFIPIRAISTTRAESADPRIVTRVGMILNWGPDRVLYVSDPLADRILALDLANEDAAPHDLFMATRARHLSSPFFDTPIDLAPAVPEVAARNFASNTTLGGGSDVYVLNRGNNTIVRVRQDGQVIAVRRIEAAVPGFRVNGIAVSEDARIIWVTATAPDRQGVVLQMPAFGAGPVTTSMIGRAANAGARGAVAQGGDMFRREIDPAQGLGPLFNGRACFTCHNTSARIDFDGGMGLTPDTFVTRVARIEQERFELLPSHGPIARQQSIDALGVPCGLRTGVPPEANATSRRSSMTLRGTALLDNIRLGDIEKVRLAQPAAVQGRFNVLPDGRRGRFGWKAQTATLMDFIGEAFRDEIGSTNPLAPRDLVEGCGASILNPEADATPLTSIAAFLNTIDPPVPTLACRTSLGASLFDSIGCATCHTPSMPGPGSAAPVFLYSDLLLHDMGSALADGFIQGSATGREFRTMPLWRVSDRQHFLHDGRARTLIDAMLAHGGQAAGARAAVEALSPPQLQALLDFLNCI